MPAAAFAEQHVSLQNSKVIATSGLTHRFDQYLVCQSAALQQSALFTLHEHRILNHCSPSKLGGSST